MIGKILNSARTNHKEKFRLLMVHLKGWRSRLEYLTDEVRTPLRSSITGQTHHAGDFNNKRDTSRKWSCWLHKHASGGHPTWKCKELRSKPVEERIKLVELNKACRICLLTSCDGVRSPKDCQTDLKCDVEGCGGEHNRLLHMEEKKVSGSTSHAETQDSTLLQLQTI